MLVLKKEMKSFIRVPCKAVGNLLFDIILIHDWFTRRIDCFFVALVQLKTREQEKHSNS